MYLRVLSLLICLGFVVSPALGLEPAEIVVVVNGSIPKSEALGRFYCDKRGVPLKNLVVLDLPATDTISQADYDRKLRGPLRAAIAERGLTDRVQCLLTVWGVPFRVAAGDVPPEIKRMLTWYAEAAWRSKRRVARNILLLGQVGAHFPETATPTTEPEEFDKLFHLSPSVHEELPSMAVLRRQFGLLARRKAAEIAAMPDAGQRAVASRQIIALFLDTFGLTGWTTAVELVGADGPSLPGSLNRDRAEAEQRRMELMGIQRPDDEVFKKLEKAIIVCRGASGLHASCIQLAASTRQRPSDSRAAVDSELSLLLAGEYTREAWGLNPLYWQNVLQKKKIEAAYGSRVLMVSRIDGPTIDSIMRLVVNSIEVEQTGLVGKAYIDIGAMKPKEFDKGLSNLALGLKYTTQIPVVADTERGVFGPGTCPEAALYVGWQSSNKYVPAFEWCPGAVGFHVAMTEARELRDPKSEQWVPRMLQAGVAATLGAVDDGGIVAFPTPSAFFPMLISGRLTVSEVYWRTIPHVSWRMMLIADPLYNPFKNSPHPMELPEEMFRPWDK